MNTRQRGSLAVLLTLGVAAALVHTGCSRPGGPGAEVRRLQVTYYYLPG